MLFLLNAASLAVKQPIPILLSEPRFEPTIYRTRGKLATHYATDAVFEFIIGMYMYLLLFFMKALFDSILFKLSNKYIQQI